jgi:outer membrane biosynthesis protein TonB
VSRFRPTRMHLLLGLAVLLMATIPVLVPLAFTGGPATDATDVARLAVAPAGAPALPAGPAGAPDTGPAPQPAPAAAGTLHSTRATRPPTQPPAPPPATPAPSTQPAPPPATTTDATTTAPAPDPTTPEPTAEAKVFAAQPNLVVVGLSWDPGAPTDGQPVVFSAVVQNVGPVATPEITHGVAFLVDGTEVTWSDVDSTPLAPGEQRTYTANNGLAGSAWTATPGEHTVEAWVDDVNRIPESNDADNTLGTQLTTQ